MITTVDARGLACPQPVIQTRKAMQSGEAVLCLVDNEAAVTNVSRMAKKAGWAVAIVQQDGDFRLQLEPSGQVEQSAASSVDQPHQSSQAGGPLVLVVSEDKMGRGNAELGTVLVRGFFHTLGEVEPRPQTIIFFNTGANLACEGSPVLEDLQALETQGIELLVCGTCLGYFEVTDKLAVGQISNMYDIAETMLNAGKVVTL